MLKKIAFWLCTAVNIAILTTVIVQTVGICKVRKFDLELVLEYHFEGIWGTPVMNIAIGAWLVAYLLLVIDYCIDAVIPLKILAIFCYGAPPVVFVLFALEKVPENVMLISLIPVLILILLLMFNEDYRYKLIYWFISGAWLFLGMIAVALAIMIFVFLIVAPLFMGSRKRYVYDEYGNFVGNIWE